MIYYAEYKGYSVRYDGKKHSFECSAVDPSGRNVPFLREVLWQVELSPEGRRIPPEAYPETKSSLTGSIDGCVMNILCSGGPEEAPAVSFEFSLTNSGIRIGVNNPSRIRVTGLLIHGETPEHSTFAINTESFDSILRAASGPAVPSTANALYDRQTDSALEFRKSGRFHVQFDWVRGNYGFHFLSEPGLGNLMGFRRIDHFCAGRFHVPWKPIDKSHGFVTPPVGWMTWYAVRFDACEETVLRNAAEFAERFRDFSGNLCIWVDWEWCHCALDGLGQENADVLHPRPEAYPHGLKYLSGKLKELGLIPAIWSGATNDGSRNELMRKHPGWVFAHKICWCGQWWIDLSHPEVLKEYIPMLFKTLLDWGFEVIKWDCLAVTLKVMDEFHDLLHDPSLSSEAALRNAVKAVRKTVGNDVYLLSCAGDTERDITFAMDLFSAARIGGDVFDWNEFFENAVKRVFHFFCFHNLALYADADNVVLREEYNTPEQARSRVSFYALTGLPLTVGDPMEKLDAFRIELLKRAMPVADVHPVELLHKVPGANVFMVHVLVERRFGNWSILGIFHAGTEPIEMDIDLENDLKLEGDHAVFDFWKQEFYGAASEPVHVTLMPGGCKVFRLTKITGHPQLISVSRHILQGAVELEALEYDPEARILKGRAACVKNDPCTLSFYVPDGFEPVLKKGIRFSKPLAEMTLLSGDNRSQDWEIHFSRKQSS